MKYTPPYRVKGFWWALPASLSEFRAVIYAVLGATSLQPLASKKKGKALRSF